MGYYRSTLVVARKRLEHHAPQRLPQALEVKRKPQAPKRDCRPEPSHQVVGHHSPSSGQLLKTIRRIELGHVENAKEQEYSREIEEVTTVSQQGHGDAGKLVDDDTLRVGVAGRTLVAKNTAVEQVLCRRQSNDR